jgi:hypothetical protein
MIMMIAFERHTSHFYTLYISIYIISYLNDIFRLQCQWSWARQTPYPFQFQYTGSFEE